jgi:alkylation response protein AidB-like acyl-CoA dehydrogenase
VNGIGFDAELELLRGETRRVLAERFGTQRVRAAIDAPPDRSSIEARAALGWSGALVDGQHGGEGLSLLQASVIADEHGRALFAATLEATAAVSALLTVHGNDAQRQTWLPAIAGGTRAVAWAGAGNADWDERSPAIAASVDASGTVRLDGVATAVHDAQVCDVLAVSARRSAGGAVHALVDATVAGIEVQPLRTLDLTRRGARVTLRGVEVASESVIADPDGVAHRHMLDVATVLSCADATGAARQLCEMSVQYAMGRSAFGRAIAGYQAIKHKCADMLVAVEGCEVATRYAALAVDTGDAGASTAVSIAKAYVSDAVPRIAGEAQQIHGGIGFTWEHDLHLYVRRVKAGAVLFGSAAWHRERVAAAMIGQVRAGGTR